MQGTRLFVSTARSLSLFESIILQPTTPTALHPNPMHMVNACLPQAPTQAKGLSRLYAILGKYPESSSMANNGKNITIGGIITEITLPTVRNTPSRRREERVYR